MVATCITLLSKHNKHATVSVKKGKRDMAKNQWMHYYQNIHNWINKIFLTHNEKKIYLMDISRSTALDYYGQREEGRSY